MITTLAPSPTFVIGSTDISVEMATRSLLGLEMSKDRFRFLVVEPGGQCVRLEEYSFPSLLNERSLADGLADICREHPVLSAPAWGKLIVSVNTSAFTLIPSPLFRKEYAANYLAFMRGSALPTHEFASAYEHADAGYYSVFNVEHTLTDFLAHTYPLQPTTLVHQTSALAQAALRAERQQLGLPSVTLYFEEEFVTILHRADGQLRYLNRFGYKNAQDLTYYVLYVLEELRLSPAAIALRLYGEITPYAERYVELAKFLPNLTIGQMPPGLRLTADFDDLPEHRFMSLYGLALLND
jgi:hypothetical protein